MVEFVDARPGQKGVMATYLSTSGFEVGKREKPVQIKKGRVNIATEIKN